MASHPYLKKVRWLFSRLLFSLGIDPSLSMMIAAFWMFVQENEVIEGIDFYLNNFCYEAVGDPLNDFEIQELIYEYAQDHDAHLKEEIYTGLGLGTNLAESSSQTHSSQGQGTMAHLLDPIEKETTSSPSIDSLGETVDALNITETTDELQHRLDIILKEERTLLVSFFDGYPLTGHELNDFFSWFEVVEEITIEEPSIRPNPLWALITFRSPYILTSVLNGEQRFHFIINGKDVWVQRYIEAKERHFAANGKDLFCWGVHLLQHPSILRDEEDKLPLNSNPPSATGCTRWDSIQLGHEVCQFGSQVTSDSK
ncbi:hypothetical protein C2845_PM12G08810 [Panicum miliaceum]|uniref:Uncharacterized protein n=1 Tax=Panicum miliaceum TaxID=4540 RepID=A0A3L6QE23_PANMI|nr:hypothetical protein C2845_PM12G08810 [Panicum miliaceum]